MSIQSHLDTSATNREEIIQNVRRLASVRIFLISPVFRPHSIKKSLQSWKILTEMKISFRYKWS